MNKKKRIIFEAAIKNFSKNGYKGATMDEIALEAGVAKGTLYYHFKNKEELFTFIISEGVEILMDRIGEVQEGDDPIENIKNICKSQLVAMSDNKDFFRVLLSQLWGQDTRQISLREQLKKYIDKIESHIEYGILKGVIEKGDPRFMSYAFFGSLISVAIGEITSPDEVKLDEAIDNLIRYNLRGLV